MPLTEQEKQEILARRQQSQSMAQPAQPAQSDIPIEVQRIISQVGAPRQGVSIPMVGGGRITQPGGKSPQDEILMEIAKKRVDLAYPTPTETERERTPMAESAVRYLDSFAQKIGLNPETGEFRNPEKLAAPMVRELVPQKFQDYVTSEDQAMVYNDLESAFQLGAIVLTGRQGDIGKLEQLRHVYSFGGAVKDKPKLANQRYQNLRSLFQTFERANAMSPEAKQKALDDASNKMDMMLKSSGVPSAEPLAPDEDAIVKRLLGGK